MCNLMKLRCGTILCWLLMVPLCLSAANKKKAPEQFGSLSFVVLRDSDGTPVKNASVVIHFLRKNGSEEPDGLQLKTDTDGRARSMTSSRTAMCECRWWRPACRPTAMTLN